MRVSIIAADNNLSVDGKWYESDCSALLEAGISAVQWYGDHGEIEFVGHKQPNEPTEDFTEFQQYIDKAIPHDELAAQRFEQERARQETEAIRAREADSRTRLGHSRSAPPQPPELTQELKP